MYIRHFVRFWLFIVLLVIMAGCVPDDRPATDKIAPAVEPPPVQRVVSLPVEPPAVTWDDYDQAVYFYTIGRYDKAADLLARIQKLILSDRQYRLVNFLNGLNARKMDRPEQVEVILGGEGKVPAALKPYADYFVGQAKFDTQQYREAREWLDAAIKDARDWPLEDRARLLKAETRHHLGDDAGAARDIKPLLKSKLEGSAMLTLAHIYERQGQTVKARDQYLQAMKNSNVREVRAEASYKYKNLLYPVVDQKGREPDKMDLVRLLRTEWRLDEAISVIDKLTTRGGSPGFLTDLAEERALNLFFSGRLEEALTYYQGTGDRATSQWMYARCLKRLGRWDEAAAAFLQAGKRSRATQCKWEAGLCYLKAGNISKAMKTWGSLTGRKSRYRDDMLWHTGHFYFQNKAFGDAEKQFRTLVQEKRTSGFARGARYWMARAQEAQGKMAPAQKIYSELASSQEDYYYRMLSEQRLGLVVRSNTWADQRSFQELISPENFGGTATWAYIHPARQYGNLKAQRALAKELAPVPLASTAVNQSIQRLYDLCDAGTMDLALLEAEYLYDQITRKRPPSARPYSKLSRQGKN